MTDHYASHRASSVFEAILPSASVSQGSARASSGSVFLFGYIKCEIERKGEYFFIMVYFAGLFFCQSEKLARTCFTTIKVMYVYLCGMLPPGGSLVH